MNILQTEDLVKGLPDQLLMEQAQAPSGEIPQFLLISEVQRRADMRKRFEQQKPEQEATVSEQILQQGIGSQPQQNQPPPQMQPQMQPPMPPQPPAAAALPPQGGSMAAGGLVKMQAGGQFTFPQMGNQYTLAMKDGQTQQGTYEQWLNEQNEPLSVEQLGADAPWNSGVSFDPQGNYMPIAVQRGEEISNRDTLQRPDQQDIYRGVTLGSDLANEASGVVDFLTKKPVHETPPHQEFADAIGGYNDLMRERAAVSAAEQEVIDQKIYEESIATEQPNEVYGTSTPTDALDPIFSFFDLSNKKGLHWAEDSTGIAALKSEEEALEDLQGAQITEEPADRVSGDQADQGTLPFGGQTQALTDATTQGTATSFAKQAAGEEGKGIANLLKIAEAETDKVPDVKDLIQQQRKAAWSNALMQLGAGIAGGDMSEGLSNAAKAMSAGTAKSREMEMQSRLAQYAADRKDLDRGVDVYGKVGQLEALEARSRADQAIQDGRNDNEIMRSSMNYINLMMAGSFSRGEEREQEVLRLLRNLMPASMLQKFGPAIIDGTMDSGAAAPSSAVERPPLTSFNS